MSASLARRRAQREPRVVVRTEHGELRTLGPDDPSAKHLQAAADALISAVHRASDG